MSCGACWQAARVHAVADPYTLILRPCTQVTADELRRVLGKRRGSTLSRRSILKSYQPHTNPRHNAFQARALHVCHCPRARRGFDQL